MNSEHWLVSYSRAVNSSLSEQTIVHFLDDKDENALLNDLENYPHAFVLACCMDRQISSERAWRIPCVVRGFCKEFSIEALSQFPLEWYKKVFEEQSLHRYNDKMAEVFYSAVLRIKNVYGGDASRIWSDKPSSAAVVYRFLEFDGVGIKIATMAANILCRQYGLPFSDYYSIDISPDVHVLRIFQRAGLVQEGASREAIIYKARELCPEFPGIVDAACWRIGREYCHAQNPNCDNCPVGNACPKILSK